MKLKHKISLLAFIVGNVVLGTTLFVHEYSSLKVAVHDSKDKIHSLSEEVAFHLDTFLDEKIKKAQTLASSPLLINALVEDNTRFSLMSSSEREAKIVKLNEEWVACDLEAPFVQNYLQNQVAGFLKAQQNILPKEYGEIFLTNEYGSIIAATGKLTTLAHAHKQWWKASYNSGQGKVFLDDRGFDESVSGYVLGVVVPVFSKNKIVGVLKCNLNIKENLEQFVSEFSLAKRGGRLRIARSLGHVVVEPGQEPLSTVISDMLAVHIQQSDTGTLIDIDENGDEHIVGYTLVPLTRGSEVLGFGGTKKTIDQAKGNEGESWYAIASIPKRTVVVNHKQTDDWPILFGLFISISLTIVAFMFGGIIVRPVSRLSEAAERISQGDLDTSVEVTDDGTLGKAAIAFNEMAKSLKEVQRSRDQLLQNKMRSTQLEVLGTVAAGVAHEINNPIQGIMNYAGLIERSPEKTERNQEIAKRIKGESVRIAKITQDLLFYSKNNRIEMKCVNITETIDSALSLIRMKIQNNNATLVFDVQQGMPPLCVQPQSLQQLVLNLVDNANDALREKEESDYEKTITVKVGIVKENDSESSLRVEVKDNGVGMSPEVLEKAQNAFFTTKPPSKGTGLGLSIVAEIAKKHNGHIEIESTEGEYTLIKAILPAIGCSDKK